MPIWDLILNKKTDQGTKRDFHEMYLNIAKEVGLKSRDEVYKVGAVLIDSSSNNFITFGYNGTPTGDCNETREKDGTTKPTVVHAETNAICAAAKHGKATKGAILYTTISPCFECSRYIIQAGIKEVIYGEVYKQEAIDYLSKFMKVRKYEGKKF